MSPLQILVAVFGFINVAGGAMGFAMSKSAMSLIAGAGFGVGLLAAAFLSREKPAIGFRIAGVLTFALVCFWAYRLNMVMAAGGSPMMPAGNLGLSLIVMAALIQGHLSAMRRRKLEAGG